MARRPTLRADAPRRGSRAPRFHFLSIRLHSMRSRSIRARRPTAVFAVLGPGLVAANAGNDAGGIATYASAGAQFAYRTLFLMVLVTVALVVVQEMSARLGAHTGEGLVTLIREQCSRRAAAFAVACLLVANLGLVVSEFAGIGAAFELLGVSRFVAVPLAAIGLWALVVFGSYTWAERGFLLLSLAFLAYPVAALLGNPDWGAVAADSVLPHFAASHGFVFLAVALVGTTVTPYMQVYQASAVADRGSGAATVRHARIDAVTGALFANLISMCIIVATAATLGGTGPLRSAGDAARALTPVAGAGATVLFAVGLLGASALAAAVVPLSTAYAVAEATGSPRSVSHRFTEAPLFLGLFTGLVFTGAAVALVPGNLIDRLLGMQVVNGLIAPVILGFVLVLANRRALLGDAVNGRRFNVVATVSVGVIAVLAMTFVVLGVATRLGLA